MNWGRPDRLARPHRARRRDRPRSIPIPSPIGIGGSDLCSLLPKDLVLKRLHLQNPLSSDHRIPPLPRPRRLNRHRGLLKLSDIQLLTLFPEDLGSPLVLKRRDLSGRIIPIQSQDGRGGRAGIPSQNGCRCGNVGTDGRGGRQSG